MGGAYAEPVQDLHKDGNTYSISLGGKDMGYIIEDGDRRFYYWVTNYSNHQLSIDGLSVNQKATVRWQYWIYQGLPPPSCIIR